MPAGQSWEIRHLPWQISVNGVRREPGRDGTRKLQIIRAILESIFSLALRFEAGMPALGPRRLY